MTSALTRICVFCGSSRGKQPAYEAQAEYLATELVASGLEVVYGGADVGLMKAVADTALARGGRVTGVIPRGLFGREIAHEGLTNLVEVDSMHERKQLMFELADAFVGLPGGLGTIEEIAEITTWSQLGLHRKPIVLVDTEGFWRPLLAQLDRCVVDGFLSVRNRVLIVAVESAGEVLPAIKAYDVEPSEKWLDSEGT